MIDKQVGLLPMGVHLSACATFLQATFSLKGLCIPLALILIGRDG